LEYVDLYCLFDILPQFDAKTFTINNTSVTDCWREMEHCKEKGWIRSLGLINCPVVMLLEILTSCNVKPAINLLEINPYFSQRDVVEFHEKLGISCGTYQIVPDFKQKGAPEELKKLDF